MTHQVNSGPFFGCNKEFRYIANLALQRNELRLLFKNTVQDIELLFRGFDSFETFTTIAYLMDSKVINDVDYLDVLSVSLDRRSFDEELLNAIRSDVIKSLLAKKVIVLKA